MRRSAGLLTLLCILMVIPVASASSDPCPTLEGRGVLNWGAPDQPGRAIFTYDGEHIVVPFNETGSASDELYFTFQFPGGDVEVTETPTITPLDGPNVAFTSTLTVDAGGSGTWEWSGISNVAAGKAIIQSITGDLCFNGS